MGGTSVADQGKGDIDWGAFADAATQAVGIPMTADQRPGVIANLERHAAFAAFVGEFDLPPDLEAAPIYDAGAEMDQ